MGIQSTKNISRDYAINRITEILKLAQESNYRGLVEKSGEDDEDSLQDFVTKYKESSILDNIENYTDKMLENIMDKPFFRESIFDNYLLE